VVLTNPEITIGLGVEEQFAGQTVPIVAGFFIVLQAGIFVETGRRRNGASTLAPN
jgi:hypothetical protein